MLVKLGVRGVIRLRGRYVGDDIRRLVRLRMNTQRVE